MLNPLFMMLQLNSKHFKNQFEIVLKKNQNDKSYFLITPKVSVQNDTKYIINAAEYKIYDYHITINADTAPLQGCPETSYHLTVNLINTTDNTKFVLHVHFDKNNKIVFRTLRDDNQNIISIDSKTNIDQLVKGLIDTFCQSFWDLYTDLHKRHRGKHEELLNQLTLLSQALTKSDNIRAELEHWQKYKDQLLLLIKHLNEWNLIHLHPDNNLLVYFNNLLKNVERKLNDLTVMSQKISSEQCAQPAADENIISVEVSASEIQQVIEKDKKKIVIDKLKEIDNQLLVINKDRNVLAWNKICIEHQLLLEKFKLLNEDEVVLDCVLRTRELEKLAYDQLKLLVSSKKDNKKLTAQDCCQLLKIIPYVEFSDVFKAVENNHPLIVSAILNIHSYININLVMQNPKLTLLEYAYKLGHKKVFIALLDAGAYCDRYDQSGTTLLLKTCNSLYVDEMVALLKAGASTFKPDPSGFSAFAQLTMTNNRKPDLGIVETFLNNCSSFNINWYQGPRQQGQTPLSYACQNNWHQLVKLLLEYSADPRIARESDFQTPLAICAIKGFDKSLQMILKYSKFKLEKGHLGQALVAAQQFDQIAIIEILKKYSAEHNLAIDDTVVSYTLGPGSDMGTVLRAANLSSHQKIVSSLCEPFTLVPITVKQSSETTDSLSTTDNSQSNSQMKNLQIDDKKESTPSVESSHKSNDDIDMHKSDTNTESNNFASKNIRM